MFNAVQTGVDIEVSEFEPSIATLRCDVIADPKPITYLSNAPSSASESVIVKGILCPSFPVPHEMDNESLARIVFEPLG